MARRDTCRLVEGEGGWQARLEQLDECGRSSDQGLVTVRAQPASAGVCLVWGVIPGERTSCQVKASNLLLD
jgi:hypothetical protein